MKEINAIKPQEPKPHKRKVLVPNVTSSPSSGKRGRPIDWKKRLAKEKEKERLKAERKQAREDRKLFKKLERDRIRAEKKAMRQSMKLARQRAKEAAKEAEKQRKKEERERLKKEREEQRKQEKAEFKEYVQGANAQLKKLRDELHMDERDLKVALGGISGIKLTKRGLISVSSKYKDVFMKQTINKTLDSKEDLIESYKKSGYGEFKRFEDIDYDIRSLKESIDKGSLDTATLVKINSESNWEEIKNAFDAFDTAILREDVQEARAQLMNIHQMLDDFDDWIKENELDISRSHHRQDINGYERPNYRKRH